jgi:phosphoribosylanthranilate isomerase
MGRVKVKICGLTRAEDIAAVNDARPDYIGFVFAEASRRRVDRRQAAALSALLAPGIEVAGVFVNQDISYIADLYKEGIIKTAQLHGDEGEAYMEQLRAACGCPIIKAVGVGEAPPPLPRGADYLLFDTLSERRGGTGKPFDWNILRGYSGPPFCLAGGLTPENVREAIGAVKPFAVDTSSGVETNGVKDAEKIRAFINAVRG